MPKRSLHDPEFDRLPAFGLREDVFDDHLRSSSIRRPPTEEERRREEARLEQEGDDYADDENDEPYDDPKIGREIWRRDTRVTTTELCVFLGSEILRHPAITSNVNAWLSGHELKRGPRQFDVDAFAVRRFGFLPKPQNKGDWRGNYMMKGVRHRLVLKEGRLDPCITVRLKGRRRLVIFASGGRMHSQGQGEPGILRTLVGRAATWRHGTPTDILAVCVPRSEHFRRAIAAWGQTEGARRLGLHFLTVERYTGAISGLEEILRLD